MVTPFYRLVTRLAIQQVRRSSTARNTGWALVAQGGRLLTQMVYFVLIARTLGVEGYGTVAAALAIVLGVSPFAGLGAGNVMVMHVARDHATFPVYWGNAILTLAIGGVLFSGAITVVGHWLLPSISWQLMLSLAIAEFFFGRFSENSAQAFLAVDQMDMSAKLSLLPSFLRLAAVAAVSCKDSQVSPELWGVLYLASTIAAALISAVVVTHLLGLPRLVPAAAWSNLRQGGYFALSQASATIYTDIDKMMLARWSTFEATGTYAAAYRATAVAFVPVRSLLFATYAQFFRHGRGGIQATVALAKRIMPFSVVYSLIASMTLFALAPLGPRILGQEYSGTIAAIRWLAPLPLLQSIHYVAADALTGADHQRLRSLIQVAVVALNVGLNLWLVPDHGWQGAAWASLASDGALAILLWAVVIWLTHSRRTSLGEHHARSYRR